MAAVFVCESPDWLPQNGKNAGLKNKYLLEEISERLIGNVIEKIINIDETISEEQLKNIVAKQYTVIKYKQVTSIKRIE